MPARRRPARVLVDALAATLAVVILAGCSAPAPDSSDGGLADITRERDRVALAAHERATERLAVFLRDKWGPIALPESDPGGWVAAEDWASEMTGCLDDRGFPGARPSSAGDRLDYGGVAIDGARDRYELDVAAFGCQAEHPVRAWFAADLVAVEAPWAFTYGNDTLAPCLLSHGFRVAAPPTVEEFTTSWRSESAPDPYRLTGPDPGARAAAEAQCPSPQTLLDAAP